MSTLNLPSGANKLLTALPAKERANFIARCEPVDLVFGDILCEAGGPVSHVYFPTEGFISLIASVESSESVEVGLVGDEGMLGSSLMLGIDSAPLRALVQGAGSALRLSAATFRRELHKSARLQRQLGRYSFVVFGQLARTAVCARFHRLDARLARWLLMTRDRARSADFRLTQEFMATMLGVRREGVTEAASVLQRRRLIAYSRGHIRILNGRALEAAACGCYRADKRMYLCILS